MFKQKFSLNQKFLHKYDYGTYLGKIFTNYIMREIIMFNLIAFLITQIGAINWLCIGIFQFDFIAGIFGSQAHFISRFLYTIVGLCSIYLLIYCVIKKGNLVLISPKKEKKSKQDKENEKKK